MWDPSFVWTGAGIFTFLHTGPQIQDRNGLEDKCWCWQRDRCALSISCSQAHDQDGGPVYLCHRGLMEVTSPVRHLQNAPPLQANNALLVLPAEVSWLSPPYLPTVFFSILLPLIGSRSWLSYCLFCLTDSSGSGCVPCLTHCPADPPGDIWPLYLAIMIFSVQSNYVVYYLIVLIRYIYLLWHTVTSFLPLYMSHPPSLS